MTTITERPAIRVSTIWRWSAVAAAWLIMRPYRGIVHDSQLYVHYAAFGRLESFRSLDLLVGKDQQLGRSLYTYLMRATAEFVGLAGAAMAATMLGLLAWIGAATALTRELFGRFWWVATIGIVVLPGYYNRVLTIAEPFATPRPLAEAAVVFSIVLFMRNRAVLAIVGVGVATLLHPLVGLTGFALVATLAAFEYRRMRWLLIAAGVLGVGFVAWDPFVIAGTRAFDETWTAIISGQLSLVFLGNWGFRDWARVVTDALLVGAYVLQTENLSAKRLGRASLVVAASGLIVSALFTWALILPLVVQLQPSRVVWILHLVALLSIVHFAIQAWTIRDVASVMRMMAVALAVVSLSLFSGLAWLVAAVLAATVLFTNESWLWQRLGDVRIVRAIAVIIGGLALVQALAALPFMLRPLQEIPWGTIGEAMPATTVLVGVLLVVAASAASRRTAPGLAAILVLVSLLGLGAATWDHRTEWQKYYEGLSEPILDLPQKSTVLLETGGFAGVALFMRPSYLTSYSAVGSVFSRDLAIESEFRRLQARRLGIPWVVPEGSVAEGSEATNPRRSNRPSRSGLLALCSAETRPDFLFLRDSVPGIGGIEWTAPVPLDDGPDTQPSSQADTLFTLYDCEEIEGESP